jgi:hypothetical protein
MMVVHDVGDKVRAKLKRLCRIFSGSRSITGAAKYGSMPLALTRLHHQQHLLFNRLQVLQ